MTTSAGRETPPALGIDVGGTKVLGQAVVPADAGVVATVRRETPAGGAAVLAAVHAVADELLAAVGGRTSGIGVGIAGLVDRAGVLRFSPNLPGVVDLDVASAVHGFGAPTAVENDATAALWGERCAGAARGASDALLVTLGTGIGGGILADGRLVLGRSGFAGEAGHMLVDPSGPECPCGRRGCWERFASGSALGRLAREAAADGRADALVARAGGSIDALRGEHVTAAVADGDDSARAVLGTFAWWVAAGLANLVDLCDPELVVVGGGLVAAGDLLLDPIREAFAELVLGHGHRRPPAIEAAALGPSATAIGAALLAAERGGAAGASGNSRFGDPGPAQ